MLNKNKLTICYERLSREDLRADQSLSIENQKQILEDYAVNNGFVPFLHLSDDGFSGTQWNRPGWQELIARVDNGEVGTILLKNLDRMGRDYLRVGLNREMFAEKGVRLIAVNDGYNSQNGDDDFTPFKDILAEWVARDTSRKIRAVFKARTENGKHVTGCIPYGFMHDPNDRQNWLIDSIAAKVVQHIFQLVIDGNGVYQIAKILENEKVLIPTAHWESLGCAENVRHSYTDPYRWRGGVVSEILKRRE
jgi:DNA invertase Pin-like site-specific DNA recombinase